jgi:predicted permease
VRRRLRVGLVVSEIALASLLLVGAGLSLRSFAALLHAEPGIELENRLTAFVSLPPSRYRGEARQAAYEEIDRRFASIAGVRATGAVNHLPLSGTNSRLSISIEGREPVDDAPMRAHPRSITPGYFTAIGMTVKAGRGFSARDRAGAPLVAVVNEAMARAYWPGESPIGQRLRLGGTEEWREVIGIVADVRHSGLDRPAAPELYLPLAQYVWNQLTFVLATEGHPSAFAAAARDQLRAIDPDLPLSRVRTMEEVAARSVASRRSGMILLATFGLLALVLSAAGIYGVTAHLVALRTAEIGVRMTLGARPGDVMRLVVREGTIQACIGLAVGLSGAMALTRPFRAMLFGVGPADPLTLAGVAAILLTTTILACLVPARRAMRVDPVQALRM